MQLTLGKDKYDQLSLHATGSALQEQYEALQEAKYVAGNRMVLDSWIICSMKLVKRGS